ncbi:MAG: extracellular solute-binding protein [Phycisphaera sp.]|nr:extracellular solute-binding protein [Phycisphaera sp.]
MKEWIPRIVVLVLFVAVVGLPVLWRPAEAKTDADAALKLVVITPHNEQIRFEIGRAFSKWHEAKYGEAVDIDWRAIGGTSDIERVLLSEYASLAEQGKLEDGAGYDVVFGGGDYSFDFKLKPGVQWNGKMESVLEPLDLDDAFIKEVYPEPTIAGNKLYDPEHYWWGVVLSSFGIVYNRDVLRLRGVPEPKTWEDLGDPKLAGWIALADPEHSGSVKVTYNAIVQNYGYERGWATLRRACANARYFSNSSSKVPLDVSAGEAAAGMCIDFYGRYQANVVGADRVGFVAPAGQTVVTADPVAVLRGCQRPQLAERFVRWLLSTEGQLLWNVPVGHAAGPEKFGLRRMPIRRDVYKPYLGEMIDRVDPFEIASPLPAGTPSYFSVIGPVMHAMAIDIHDDLRDAWRTINQTTDEAQRAEMLKLFDAMPLTSDELLARKAEWKKNPDTQIADRLAWTTFYRDNYRRIVEMGR